MCIWRQLTVLSTILLAAVATSSSHGQTPKYRLERVASGLQQPVYMDQAPGDPANIIYYMTRVTTGGANAGNGTGGSIWRYNMDTRQATEVLNLSHRNLTLDLGPQGFAFHPDFNMPGAPGYQKLYVSTAATGGPVNYVEEYLTNGPNGTVPVDGGSGEPVVNRTLLEYTNVFGDNNHVIDWIGFDPRAYSAPVGSPERDYLFISAGDGSNGRDAPERPEQKANIEQGKLLRIDVDPTKPDFYPGDPLKNFAIPATNPIPLWNSTHGPSEQLVGTTLNYSSPSETISYTPALPEIYFTGTRNTYRMSMDLETGAFWSGDVGENFREEVNFLPADPYDGSQLPYDFGYPQREGTVLGADRSAGDTTITWDLSGGGTAVANSVNPIQEGNHGIFNSGSTAGDVEIRSTPRSAYIGGYVYRGPVEELQGKYFYSDFVQGNIFSLDFDTSTPVEDFSGTNLNQVEVQPGVFTASLGTREVVLNRNLNSLWHTIMVDPQDPTYTPDLGASFGIGRVVSFGEDNAGNLYIIDMGGVRGNAGFGNDYPGTSTGQIFRITPLLGITLSINRDTGEITLANDSGSPIDLDGYTINSPSGAISIGDLIPITGNYDSPSPPGDGSIDGNNSWQITSNSKTQFGEETTGDMGTLAAGQMISLGGAGAWVQSIYEDWTLQVDLPGGSSVAGIVEFTGNGDLPFERSDLSFAGGIGPEDWNIFKANFFGTFAGLSPAESYSLGDLDGDGDNDYADFRLFKEDYIAANGLQAFQQLVGVPEPTGLVLLLGMVVSAPWILGRHRRPPTELASFSRATPSMAAAVGVAAIALAAQSADAALVHQYTFNEGTAADSVGSAHGTLEGNASVALGVANLPGGGDDFIDLPGDTIDINSYTNATFEAWFTYGSSDAWQRVFDFGRTTTFGGQGRDYLFYTPSSSFGDHRAAITDNANGDEDVAAAFPALSQNQLYHVAVVVDDSSANQLRLYLDGQPVGSTTLNVSMSDLSNSNAYLGKSNWSGDANLTGSIDEFRIYDTALDDEAVMNSFLAGPTPLASFRLEVNTVTGAVTIATDNALPTSIDYYAIRSNQNALDIAGWQSLDAQGIDATGSGTGQSWDEAEQVDSSTLGELFLLGSSSVSNSSPLSIGSPFNPYVFGLGQDGDLTLEVGLEGGKLLDGEVVYITPELPPGDFDGDLDVDGRDFLLWQRGLSFDPFSAADLMAWQNNYGVAPLAAATSVPEPDSLKLWMSVAFLLLATSRHVLSVVEDCLRDAFFRGRKLSWLLVGGVVCGLYCSSADASLTHQYTFNQGVQDSIGGAHGTLFGNATTNANGELVLPGGTGDYLSLDAPAINIPSYTDASFEAWFTVGQFDNWARLFDIGDRTVPTNEQGYIYYTPYDGGGNGLGIFANNGDRTNIPHGSNALDQQYHFVMTIDDNANGGTDLVSIYRDGQLLNSVAHTKSLSLVHDTFAYLGRSLVPDPYLTGTIDEFRIYNHPLTLSEVQTNFAAGPTPLATFRLEVNTVTGAARILTDTPTAVSIDYYSIRSDQGALNLAGWQSLDAQGVDATGAGTGQSWDQAELIDSSVLGELYLLGSSGVSSNSPLSLGSPFNPHVSGLGQAGDLTFEVGIAGGGLLSGEVVYVTPDLPDGDFDGDLDVDGHDFLLWQRGLSFDPFSTADLMAWQNNYGTTPAASAVQSVPEPTALILIVSWAGVVCQLRR